MHDMREADSMMVWLAQRASVAEHLVSHIDGGAGPLG
jgi:hypothetical protein